MALRMRFRIEVNTLDGKLTYQRDNAADALAVAEGAKESLGVRIVDGEDNKSYAVEEFKDRFAN
jgi:hypothetical protein